jgi:prophage DNA circulation protein
MAIDLAHVASFRDIRFPCLSVSGKGENALAKTTYPHRDGTLIKNYGRLGEAWTVTAIFAPDFNGRGPYPADLWPQGWLRFYEALRQKERGYFDHPYFGRAWAQVSDYSYDVDPVFKNTLRVQVSFEESNLDEPTFDLVLGDTSVTEAGATDRAAQLDADLQSLYPDIDTGSPFSEAFLAYLGLLLDALFYDDLIVAVNIHNQSMVSIIADYPLIEDPLGWNLQAGIILMRRDATILASRKGGEDRRVTTWENKATRSSVEIVIALYNDTARESQFLELNNIQDPLFVPPGTYRVHADFYAGSSARSR